MAHEFPPPGYKSLGTFQLTAFERTTLSAVVAITLLTLGLFQILGFANGNFWFKMFALSALLLTPVILGITQGHMDILEPIFLVNAAYFLYFVWGPSVDWISQLHVIFGTDIVATIDNGTRHTTIAVASMLIGYYMRFGGAAPAKRPAPAGDAPLKDFYVDPPRDAAAVRYAVIVTVAGIVCLGLTFSLTGWNWTRLLTLGQFGADVNNTWLIEQNPFLNYLYLTMEWFLPALMIMIAFHKPRTRNRVLLLIGFVIIFTIYMTIGFRYRILLLMLAPVTYLYMLRRRRPGLGGLLIAGFVTVLMIGLIGGTRSATRTGRDIDTDVFEVAQSGSRFANDLRIYPPYYTLLQAFPTDHDYLWGSSYLYVFLSPIPRALWPGKPDAPVRVVLRTAFGERAVQQGLAYPNLGEFYVNFGLPGEILGMALFGYLLRRLWSYVRRNAHDRWALIWYALWLPFLVQVVSRGYFVQIAQEFAFIFLPILLGRRLFGPAAGVRAIRARAAERLPGHRVGIAGR